MSDATLIGGSNLELETERLIGMPKNSTGTESSSMTASLAGKGIPGRCHTGEMDEETSESMS